MGQRPIETRAKLGYKNNMPTYEVDYWDLQGWHYKVFDTEIEARKHIASLKTDLYTYMVCDEKGCTIVENKYDFVEAQARVLSNLQTQWARESPDSI